jgi:2-haloacid dehalogenase
MIISLKAQYDGSTMATDVIPAQPYRTLLFDLDDTLLDFGVARLAAHRAMCEAHAFPFDDALHARFNQINEGLWKAYEEGRIPQTQVLHSRHEILFKEYGYVVDGAVLDATYKEHLSQGFHPIPGALELVAELRQGFSLYIVSNGVATIQASRLEGSGLRPHFQDVFISDAIGAQKPHKAFFEHVFARIPAFSPAHTLIIGDSLSADIAGGHGAGIHTCWYNPGGKPNPTGLTPTYEIRHYDELRAIVGRAGG